MGHATTYQCRSATGWAGRGNDASRRELVVRGLAVIRPFWDLTGLAQGYSIASDPDDGYATRHIHLPARPLGDDRIVVVGPQPGCSTGMYLAEQEHGWWSLTVFGYRGYELSRDPEGFARFVSNVAPADAAGETTGTRVEVAS